MYPFKPETVALVVEEVVVVPLPVVNPVAPYSMLNELPFGPADQDKSTVVDVAPEEDSPYGSKQAGGAQVEFETPDQTGPELPELLALCDRILVMSEGQMTADISSKEASQEKVMKAAVPRMAIN